MASWTSTLLRIGGAVAAFVVLGWLVVARPVMDGKEPRYPDARVSPTVLREQVQILSQRWFPRSYEYPEHLDGVAEYVGDRFVTHGARVSEQAYEVGGRTYRNVLAEYGPPGGAVIVVGAHYDTAGEQPGADDNASGVAGLLELGRLLGQAELRSRVILAAYTLEEPPFFRTGFMGSAVHARSLKEQGARVRLMISLEMIGFFSDEEGSQDYPMPLLRLFYPSSGRFIAVVDRLFSLQASRLKRSMRRDARVEVHSLNAPTFVPGVDFSDHRSFWEQGYPAVMVTDTAFYRNRAYHSAADKPERLDYDKMAEVVLGVYAHVSILAARPPEGSD